MRSSIRRSSTKRFLVLLVCGALLSAAPAHARRKKHVIVDEAEDLIGAALVKPPQDLETCFSPEERCDVKLVKFIESAQASLEIAIYDINLGNLVSRIAAKAHEIPVRLVVDRKQAKEPHSGVRALLRAGVQLRFGHQRGIMHNKFVIVDGRMVETGSFNQTNGAARANNENQVYLANAAVVERFHKRFEKLWSEGLAPEF